MTQAALLAGLLIAAGAVADEPVRRQTAADLAYVLGEVHALGRLCAGGKQDPWRARMEDLLKLEAGDEGLRRRLMQRFNSGYLAASAAHAACGPGDVEAERRLRREGADLALRLAGGAAE